MNLNTSRLELTEITEKDLADIHKLNSIFEVSEFNTIGIPENIEVTKNLLKHVFEDQLNDKRKHFVWAIKLKETNAFIGVFGLNLGREKSKSAEIYYNLSPDYWGNGYGIESANEILRYCFDDLNLHRIEAGCATENVKSIRLLEKIGMQKEGLHRGILPIRGQWVDNYHYAILDIDRK